MGYDQNPLGDRGKSLEDKWAHERDKELIEKARKEREGEQPADGKPADGAATTDKSTPKAPTTAGNSCGCPTGAANKSSNTGFIVAVVLVVIALVVAAFVLL